MRFRSILIGTDGSKANRRAVRVGLDLSRQLNAKVHAVYVVDTTIHGPGEMMGDTEEYLLSFYTREGRAALEYVEEQADDIMVETKMLKGHPAETLVEYALDNNVDVIVLGSLGRTGITRFLMGSVAEKVIRTSPLPVLLVRGD